jgi:hypothetical protein
VWLPYKSRWRDSALPRMYHAQGAHWVAHTALQTATLLPKSYLPLRELHYPRMRRIGHCLGGASRHIPSYLAIQGLCLVSHPPPVLDSAPPRRSPTMPSGFQWPNPGPCPLFSSSQRPRLAPATAFLRATAFFPNPPAQTPTCTFNTLPPQNMPTVKAYLRAS